MLGRGLQTIERCSRGTAGRAELPAEAYSAPETCAGHWLRLGLALDRPVAEALLVAFEVIVLGAFLDHPSHMPVADREHNAEVATALSPTAPLSSVYTSGRTRAGGGPT